MKRNIYLVAVMILSAASAFAQPSLNSMKSRLQTSRNTQTADFTLSEKMPFLGSLKFIEGNAPSKDQ